MSLSLKTQRRRIAAGYTQDEAENCPVRTPLWIYRIERDEGMSLREILADTAATARETGYTLPDLAREWGVPRSTLQHWASKYGVHFPQGASALCREAAARNAQRINEQRGAA